MATAAQIRLEIAYRNRLAAFLRSEFGDGKLETSEAFDYMIRTAVKPFVRG